MSVNKSRVVWRIVQGVAAVAVLAGAGLLSWYLMETSPTAPRAKPAANARLVTTTTLTPGPQRVTVEAMGTVAAAQEVNLTPQVSGQVIEVADEFVPGGRFAKGELILRIDPRDYQLIVEQKKSELAKAKSDLQMEEGNQKVAEHEYEMLGKTMSDVDRALVLRQPQLQAAQAAMAMAKAQLEKAELDLKRTEVLSPINAIVADRSLQLGGQANTNTSMATLIGTDQYWIRVSVPTDDLKWITIPGSPVEVRDPAAWGADAKREGRVIRLESGLETEGRMAQVIVAVDDPLCLTDANRGKPVLLLDEYVSVRIAGKQLQNVVKLDRSLLREDDTLWVMNGQDQLEIRPVDVVFRGRDSVLVSGETTNGARVISSELAGATEGMPLREADDATAVSDKESANER